MYSDFFAKIYCILILLSGLIIWSQWKVWKWHYKADKVNLFFFFFEGSPCIPASLACKIIHPSKLHCGWTLRSVFVIILETYFYNMFPMPASLTLFLVLNLKCISCECVCMCLYNHVSTYKCTCKPKWKSNKIGRFLFLPFFLIRPLFVMCPHFTVSV